MKSYTYLTLLFLLASIVGYGGTKSTTVVKGQVLNPRGNTIKLSTVADYFTHEPMEYTIDLAGDNRFEFEISVDEAKIAKLQHGNSEIEIFIEPEQELSLSFDAWDMQATVIFEGDGASNNTYLNLFEQKFARLTDEYIIYKMASMNAQEFKIMMKKKRQEKNAFYQKHKKSFKFTKTFDGYAKADIDYWFGHHLMRFRWEHAFYNDIPPPLDLPYEYFDFLREDIAISNDEAVTNEKYLFFLDQFLEYENARIRRIVGPSYKEPKYRGAEQHLTGKAMYYILANELYLKCKSNQTYVIGNDVRRFLENCENESYKDLVKAEYKKANGLEAGAPAPNFSLVDTDNQVVSLNDFKGKVVYVDFWATWCVPCRHEILNSKRLKQEFQGREVVFLYISLDTNVDSWRRFLQKHELKGVHLFARDVYKSDVATQYGVRGLPSFFLIDKSGNLARVPAKRSSEPGVVSEINEVLAR